MKTKELVYNTNNENYIYVLNFYGYLFLTMKNSIKVYITARFKGSENKYEIEQLCDAVRQAGMQDFCFVRDVENYRKTFDDPVELWQRAFEEIEKCDALLIDVSDQPTGGRVIEAGIAFGLQKPVFVVVKKGTDYKDLYNGISTMVIKYSEPRDITEALARYST